MTSSKEKCSNPQSDDLLKNKIAIIWKKISEILLAKVRETSFSFKQKLRENWGVCFYEPVHLRDIFWKNPERRRSLAIFAWLGGFQKVREKFIYVMDFSSKSNYRGHCGVSPPRRRSERPASNSEENSGRRSLLQSRGRSRSRGRSGSRGRFGSAGKMCYYYCMKWLVFDCWVNDWTPWIRGFIFCSVIAGHCIFSQQIINL